MSAEDPPPLASAVPVPPGQVDAALARLDELAAGMMARSGVPGMAVAVVRDGATVYAKGFGLRAVGDPRPVDADTVFQIASLSKPLSATVVARQVGLGVIAWDTPVTRHLPWFALKDPWVTSHLTIGDLFAHRSGLPDHAGDLLEDLGYGRRAVLERMRELPLAPFRVTYAYTNFGLTAAAEAVAAASGADWESLCEQALFQPLGMASTSARHADFVSRPNRALGHVKLDGRYRPGDRRQPDAQAPAGGVSSSVNDLARWMAMVLANGKAGARQLIAEAALLPAVTGQIVSAPSGSPAARPGLYGFGFNVGSGPSGRMMLSHSGAFSLGAGTNFVMLPSLGIGIVVLTNASPTGAAESLAMNFADLVQFGAVSRDWFALYGPYFEQAMKPTGKLLAAKPGSPAPSGAALASYAGVYANPYWGDAEVKAEGDGLVLTLGPKPLAFPLTAFDADRFSFSPSGENATPGSLSAVTFKRDASTPSLTIETLDEDGLGTFAKK